MFFHKLSSILVSILFLFAVAACDQEGPAEKAGEKIDQAVEETTERLQETGEAIEEKAEEAKEEVKEATQ